MIITYVFLHFFLKLIAVSGQETCLKYPHTAHLWFYSIQPSYSVWLDRETGITYEVSRQIEWPPGADCVSNVKIDDYISIHERFTITTKFIELGYRCPSCDPGFEGLKCGFDPSEWSCTSCAINLPEYAAYNSRNGQCSWTCMYNKYIQQDPNPSDNSTFYQCVDCSKFNHVIKYYSRRPESCQTYDPRYKDPKYISNQETDCCELCRDPLTTQHQRCPVGTYYLLTRACSELQCIPCTNKKENEDYFLLNGIESADYTMPNSCYVIPKKQLCNRGTYPIYTHDFEYTCVECTKEINEYILAFDIYQSTNELRHCQRGNCLTSCQDKYYNRNCENTTYLYSSDNMCAPCVIQERGLSNKEHQLHILKDVHGICRSKCTNGFYISVQNEFSTYTEIRCTKCLQNSCGIGEYSKCDGTTLMETTCVRCPNEQKPSIFGAVWTTPNADANGPEACRWKCEINYYRSGEFCIPCSTSSLVCETGFYIQAQCLLGSGVLEPPSCQPCFAPENSTFTSTGKNINDPLSCAKECTQSQHFVFNRQICMPRTITSCPDPSTYLLDGGAEAEHQCLNCIKPLQWNYYSYVFIQTCVYVCQSGYYIDAFTEECTRCPNGKFKSESGNRTCSLCPPNTYQSYLDRPQKCNNVPENANSSDDRSQIICLQGYTLNDDDPFQIVCDLCDVQISSIPSINLISNILYKTNKCTFDAVTCNQGYRLEWNVADYSVPIPQCLPCTPVANIDYEEFNVNTCTRNTLTCKTNFYRKSENTVLSCVQCPVDANAQTRLATKYTIAMFSFTPWAMFNDFLVSKCGRLPSCLDAKDEINMACSIPNGCNNGYYLNEWYSNATMSVSKTQRCDRCAKNPSDCSPGHTFFNCTGNQRENICQTCAQKLTEGQMWTIGNINPCAWSCTSGYFIPNTISTTMCSACPEGYYQPLNNSNSIYSCIKCSNGFTSGLAKGSSACTACPAGTYSNALTTNCSQCEITYYSNTSAATSCKECPRNSYSREKGQSSCIYCTYNLPYLPTPSSNCTVPTSEICSQYPGFYIDTVSGACLRCPTGAYCYEGLAYLCPYNENQIYSPATSSKISDCTKQFDTCTKSDPSSARRCPNNTGTSGTSSLRGHSSLWCRASTGYYGEPGNIAYECPRNHYCTTITPTACPPAAIHSPPKSFRLSHCTPIMYTPCKMGFFLPFGQVACQQCTEGSYCPGNDLIIACDWSTNWYSNVESIFPSNCSSKAQSATLSCPSNTQFPLGIPLNSLTRCRASRGYYFIPGYHSQGVICPESYFCPLEALKPEFCPPNEKCDHAMGLLVNTRRCPLGSFEPAPPCLPCPQSLPTNAYYPKLNNCSFCCNDWDHKLELATSGQTHCVRMLDSRSCPRNFYMEYSNSQCIYAVQTCRSCQLTINEVSSFSIDTTERNTYITSNILPPFGNGSCEIICRPGFYKHEQECLPCTAGKYSSHTGMMINETACLNCSQGTYAANTGSSFCHSCGKWSIPASDEKCAKCEIANEDRSRCLYCKSWKVPAGGRTNCTCVKGTFVKVYIDPKTSRTTFACEECPVGSISSSINPFICDHCEPGNVCNIRKSILFECPPGSYKSTPNSSCLMCEPGLYSDTKESTTCKICTAGTYASAPNSTSCTKCPENTSSKIMGAFNPSVCTVCASSMSSPEGSIRCECPELTYLSPPDRCIPCTLCHSNATNVKPCPRGSTQDTSICVCKDGFTGDGYKNCQECNGKDKCVCPANEFLTLNY